MFEEFTLVDKALVFVSLAERLSMFGFLFPNLFFGFSIPLEN